MLLALLMVLAQSHPPPALPRGCRDRNCVRGRVVANTSPGFAAFEFAPADGTGMGTACAGTVPTDVRGGVLTFTRASSATCLKAQQTTGINNGDMVTLSANQPIISPRPDLGTGQLGWLYEPLGVEDILQTESFDNIAWTKASSGVAAPIVTADQAVSPDGSTTADRIQFAATTGSQFSVVDQSAGTHAYVGSVFVKGNGTSGTLDLDCNTGVDSCQTCSFNSTTWTRCSCINATSGASLFIIGNYAAGCVAGARSAQDVFAVGGNFVEGTYLTSYIKATTVPVTRADGILGVTQAVLSAANAATNANGCIGADVFIPTVTGTTLLMCGLSGGDSGGRLPFTTSLQVRGFDGTNQNSSTAAASLTGSLVSMSALWLTGTGINSYSPAVGGFGTLQATYSNLALGSGGVTIGHTGSGCPTNDLFWVSRFRADKYATGCQ